MATLRRTPTSDDSADRSATASDTTQDSLFDGALSLRQPAPRTGYRVNVDAILLAAFAARTLDGGAPARRARHAFDLGSGVGAVGLTLLHLGAAARVTMIELEARLADLARTNAEANGFAEQVDILHGDVRSAAQQHPGAADLVVCNPPYVTPGRGRPPRAHVRSAKYGDLDAFVEAARRLTGRRARACFVYPALEATTLLTSLRGSGLEPKRLRAVHGRPTDNARVVLVECAPGKPGGLAIEPPFIETDPSGNRSASLTRLLQTPRA